MPKKSLLPGKEKLACLLSGQADDEELQSEHRLLDYRIEQAEKTQSHTWPEINVAKQIKLAIKDQMEERGIETISIKRKHLRLVA